MLKGVEMGFRSGLLWVTFWAIALAGRSDDENRSDRVSRIAFYSPRRDLAVLPLRRQDRARGVEEVACLWTGATNQRGIKQKTAKLQDCIPLCYSRSVETHWARQSSMAVLEDHGPLFHYSYTFVGRFSWATSTVLCSEFEDITPHLADAHFASHPVKDIRHLSFHISPYWFFSRDGLLLVSYESSSQDSADEWRYQAAYDVRKKSVRKIFPEKAKELLTDRPSVTTGVISVSEGFGYASDPWPALDMPDTVSPSGVYALRTWRDPDWQPASRVSLKYRETGKYAHYPYVSENESIPVAFIDNVPVRCTWASDTDTFGVFVGGRSSEVQVIIGSISRASNGSVQLITINLSSGVREALAAAFGDTFVIAKYCNLQKDDSVLLAGCEAGPKDKGEIFQLLCYFKEHKILLKK